MTDAERFNTVHVAAGSSTGGQFGSAGGGGSAKPAAGHAGHGAHPATHTGPPRHTLAYNPKTNKGAGYGMPHGDPNVKQLQTALNRLGLTDSHGKALKVDGKLGPLTTSSIKALQTRLGLPANGHVSPKFFAQILALKSLPAHRSEIGGGRVRADMSTASVDDLPDDAFAYIEPGGTKDPSGKTTPRALRHFPVHDKAHAQNALARAPQSPFGEKAMPKIRAAATKFGIDVADSGRTEFGPTPFVRSFPLSDISIRAGGDGRTVDAYATVFDTPTQIRDQDGDYIEVIDRRAFDRILPKLAPSGGRSSWRVGVFYNHGMTLHGTPSDAGSLPIGVPLDIKADGHGLFTRTRYQKGADIDRILESISEGSLSAYSFSGRFDRSDPMIPRGGFRADRRGNLPTVRRTESTLREYGPTPFPAYQDAAIVGVRAEQITEQLDRITELLRSGGTLPDFEPADLPLLSGAPEHRDSPPEDSHTVRSGRSVKEELAARRSAFLQKYGSEHARDHYPRRA